MLNHRVSPSVTHSSSPAQWRQENRAPLLSTILFKETTVKNSGIQDTPDRLLVMTVNGEPVYAEPLSDEPVTEDGLRDLVVLITQDEGVAEAWLDRPNLDLGDRTPREVAREGQGYRAANILRGFLTL